MRSLSSIAAVAGLLAVGLTALVVTHPNPEHLATAEMPAPAVEPVIKPLRMGIIQPIIIPVAKGGVMHPAPDCPAPNRGFNPLYAKAAHKHAPFSSDSTGCTIHSLAERESNQKPDAKSPVGAKGIMQFMPPTARELGIDALDPVESVDGAGRYLKWLERRFPHVADVDRPKFMLASYNWGVGNVRRTGCATWKCLLPLLPRETRIYVAGIRQMSLDGTWYREAR